MQKKSQNNSIIVALLLFTLKFSATKQSQSIVQHMILNGLNPKCSSNIELKELIFIKRSINWSSRRAYLEHNDGESKRTIKSGQTAGTTPNHYIHGMGKYSNTNDVDSIKSPAIFRSALRPRKIAGSCAFCRALYEQQKNTKKEVKGAWPFGLTVDLIRKE